MQVFNSQPSASRVACRVIGLHCFEEVALLRRVLDRHAGVADVSIDQIRAQVSFLLAEPATMESVSAAVSRAGLRLIHGGDAAPRSGVEPFVWWSGLSSNMLLVAAVLVQFVMSGGDWVSLLAEAEGQPLHPAALAAYLLAVAAAGVIVVPRAVTSLRHARLDMNVLVVVAALGAIWLGEVAESAMVAGFFSGAQFLESWSAARARLAVGALMQGTDQEVCCRVDGREHRTPTASVTAGMVLSIRPGQRFPVDAEIVSGSSSIDESANSGEPTYVRRGQGDRVAAGAINGAGALEVRALGGLQDSTLARMIASAEGTRAGQTTAERWVERFARVYTPTVVGVALMVWLVPPLLGFGLWDEWFRRGLVVTLVACPCALVIATPLTIVAAISTAARAGVLVKHGTYLEQCAHLHAVAFDKTGVATMGQPEVVGFRVFEPFDEVQTLRHIVALEARSEHPLAKALLAHAASRGVGAASTHSEDVQAVPGLGLEGAVDGQAFWIGSARFLERHARLTPEAANEIDVFRARGLTVVACGAGAYVWAVFGARDETRRDAVEAARALRARGVRRLALLSGDHEAAVHATAAMMQVDEVLAECMPEDKARAMIDLRSHGPAAMVGDGINDVPALAAASLGVAVGPRATDAALQSADVVLVHDDLSRLPWLIDHARRALSVVRQNVLLAVLIKLAFVLAAATGHATLWMAVLADTGATLVVTANGLRMLRSEIPPPPGHSHRYRAATEGLHSASDHHCHT